MLTNALFAHRKIQIFLWGGGTAPIQDPIPSEPTPLAFMAPRFSAFGAASTPSASQPHSAIPAKKFCGRP